MKRVLLILFILLFASWASPVYSQVSTSSGSISSTPAGMLKVDVSASVGEFLLSLSGFQSKNASLVLTSKEGTFLASTVADSKGNFSFSVPIKSGFNGFCITAIDFARLGDTTTCVETSPATKNITMKNIFIPPTLGLSRTEIGVNGKAVAFGYTMPNAKVTLHISGGLTMEVTADKNGYWQAEIANLPVGTYEISATANYQNSESLTPTKSKKITVVSEERKVIREGLSFVKDLFDKLKGLGFLFWIAIALIIAILILLRKLFPQAFSLPNFRFFHAPWKLPKEKKLHHWWWVGY